MENSTIIITNELHEKLLALKEMYHGKEIPEALLSLKNAYQSHSFLLPPKQYLEAVKAQLDDASIVHALEISYASTYFYPLEDKHKKPIALSIQSLEEKVSNEGYFLIQDIDQRKPYEHYRSFFTINVNNLVFPNDYQKQKTILFLLHQNLQRLEENRNGQWVRYKDIEGIFFVHQYFLSIKVRDFIYEKGKKGFPCAYKDY